MSDTQQSQMESLEVQLAPEYDALEAQLYAFEAQLEPQFQTLDDRYEAELALVQQIGEGTEYMDESVLKACQRLRALINEEAIDYIDFSEHFKQLVGVEDLYRDHIHLSEAGNFMVTQAIATKVVERLIETQGRRNGGIPHSLHPRSPNQFISHSINPKTVAHVLAYPT